VHIALAKRRGDSQREIHLGQHRAPKIGRDRLEAPLTNQPRRSAVGRDRVGEPTGAQVVVIRVRSEHPTSGAPQAPQARRRRLQSAEGGTTDKPAPGTTVTEGIGFIGQLYDTHDASVEPVTGLVDARRKALAEPILKDLAAWLERERPKLDPSSPIEVAMGYIQRQWTGLTRFLEDGSLRLDNNPSELELRHQKVGAKNWLFCATDGGAEWNAVVVSLIASCRMHDIEPLAYLRDLLTLLLSCPPGR
jgi:hypothetical protein